MKDRSLLFGIVLVAALAVASAIALGHPNEKEPPPPGVTTAQSYIGEQHNQVLL